MKEGLREQLEREVKDYDTTLNERVVGWLDALLEQGKGLPNIYIIVMVCRFDNWNFEKQVG